MVAMPQVIFVHGLFSSVAVWDNFENLLTRDRDLRGVEYFRFGYSTPKFRIRPTRKIPSFDDLADRLRGFIESHCDDQRPLIIVSHSQGGLIVQRFLAASLDAGFLDSIRQVKMVVMFSCPNSGSDILLSIRRMFIIWSHAQEKELRPINELVTKSRRTILWKIIRAKPNDPKACHIPIFLYAGDTDNVVTSVSAFDVFPLENTRVIEGDHSSIIQPTNESDESYKNLRKRIVQVIEDSAALSNCMDVDEEGSAEPNGSVEVDELLKKAREYEGQNLNHQADATYRKAVSTGNLHALQDYSRFQRRQGDLVGSIRTSDRLIEVLIDGDDTEESRVHRSRVMSSIGVSQRNLGKLQQSEQSLREAIRAARGSTNAELEARAYALDNLGITLVRTNDTKAARRCYDEALEIRERVGGMLGLANTVMNLARLDMREGSLDRSLEGCERAMEMLDESRNAAEIASVFSLRGEAAFSSSNFDVAERHFEESLKYNEATGRAVNIALSQHQLARTFFELGDIVKAEMYARRARENYHSASNYDGETGVNQTLARIATMNGENELAASMLEECAAKYSDLGNLTGEAWSTFYLAKVLYLLNRPAAAGTRFERATVLAASIDNASLRHAIDTFKAD
ncbi:alpha/beta fold hydrolase [Rhodococcus sp. NPDC058639]|uniref:alpha/beta fold hydrolase n=1 Tax=Rhodococcus sp. NPDC058639 TaxID=3346570 RepID=UPI003666E135